jgi:ArsR family transcriptional regulator
MPHLRDNAAYSLAIRVDNLPCAPDTHIRVAAYEKARLSEVLSLVSPVASNNNAELLRVLAHPIRIALLEQLAGGPRCVSDIQDLLEIRQPNVSQHLAALRREGIVDYHEDGKMRCYYVARPDLVRALLRFLRGDYPVVECSPAAVRRRARQRTATQVAVKDESANRRKKQC